MKKLGFFEKRVLLLLIFTLISGALRKWVFTTSSSGNVLFLIQLLLPFIISITHQGLTLPTKQNILKFYFLYLLISAFNPLNLTIFHGILGIILHLGFWWLIGYYYENRLFIDVRPLIPWVILFCFIEIVLGFIQYQLPVDHILNVYASSNQLGENSGVAMVGNAVRITGTFSFISGFTSFLIFTMFFIWTLIRLDYYKRTISYLLTGTIFTALMSGSRSSVFFTAIFLFLIVISEFTGKTLLEFSKSLLMPFILLSLLFLSKGSIGLEKIMINAYSNFDERRTVNAQSGEQNQRVFWDLQDLLNYRGKYPFGGVGLGATYQGATSVFGVSDYVKEYGYYENELPRIVLEGGFFLLIFRIGLVIWLLSWLELNNLSKIAFFIILIYGISTVFNIYSAIFLAIGLIFLDNISLQKRLNSQF